MPGNENCLAVADFHHGDGAMISYTKPTYFISKAASGSQPVDSGLGGGHVAALQAPTLAQTSSQGHTLLDPGTDMLPTATPLYIVGCGGPLLLDIYRPVYMFHMVIKGAGTSFAKLHLVSSLTFSHGLCVKALELFAYSLQATVYSSRATAEDVPIRVISGATQASLEIGVGPAGTDHNDLFLRTVTGETFVELIQRLLIVRGDPASSLVALMPVEPSQWGAIESAPRPGLPQPLPGCATHNRIEMNHNVRTVMYH